MQLQPLAREVVDEAIDAIVRQHPVHFLAQPIAGESSATYGRGEEALIGHRTPEEIREPRGEFPFGETFTSHRIALDKVDESASTSAPAAWPRG